MLDCCVGGDCVFYSLLGWVILVPRGLVFDCDLLLPLIWTFCYGFIYYLLLFCLGLFMSVDLRVLVNIRLVFWVVF